MQSIGAKIPCPSGEQIVNGGFEKGDFTGWTYGTTDGGSLPTITSDYSHSGTYSCWLYYDYCRLIAGWIRQDLVTSINVDCVKNFKLYIGYYAGTRKVKVTLIYTDGTEQNIEVTLAGDVEVGYWDEVDLLSYLLTGKTVQAIKISNQVTGGSDILVDDVSLEGKG
jgi:hypothetical protein